MYYFCCKEQQREAVMAHPFINGIDLVDVRTCSSISSNEQGQALLVVHFLKPLQRQLTLRNVLLKSDESAAPVKVISAKTTQIEKDTVLILNLDKLDSTSCYTLRLVHDATEASSRPPIGFDVLMSTVDFFFNVGQTNTPDDLPTSSGLPVSYSAPDIDYLAKDYTSFLRLMLDRMSQLMPQWQERSVADLGTVLLELLAYVGDYLSYQQEVIATEAYLFTARRRVSMRRHVRLIDYFMHDGCNARAWVQIQVSKDLVRQQISNLHPLLPKGTTLLTHLRKQNPRIPTTMLSSIIANEQVTVFKTLHPVTELYEQHNKIRFYTWSARECCLPRGATHATLRGHLSNLKKGQVLLFQEVLDPVTGSKDHADKTHRCAVRLTHVSYMTDPLGDWLQKKCGPSPQILHRPSTSDALAPIFRQENTDEECNAYEDEQEDTDNALELTEITWDAEDALPFPLTISSKATVNGYWQYIEDVSIALGNILLVDHGRTIENEELGVVPSSPLTPVAASSNPQGDLSLPAPIPIPMHYRPQLKYGPLTYVAPSTLDDTTLSATAVMRCDNMQDAQLLPDITLHSTEDTKDSTHHIWYPKRDLLKSAASAREFVTEIEDDNAVMLRFGDGQHGARPQPGTSFTATYRIGNGTQGNVGAETIAHIVSDHPEISAVCNPLPAQGGRDPESMEDVRQLAPTAWLTQKRAITAADYVEMARLHPAVLKATTTIRCIGGLPTIVLTVEHVNRRPINQTFKETIYQHMNQFRPAGYDLVVKGPVYVSIEIEISVLIQPYYSWSEVRTALLEALSNRELADGRRGLFHPENFAFGQPVYSSLIYAVVLQVAGVGAVKITTFQRQNRPGPKALLAGKIAIERMEIARLDNDPHFPGHGVLHIREERPNEH